MSWWDNYRRESRSRRERNNRERESRNRSPPRDYRNESYQEMVDENRSGNNTIPPATRTGDLRNESYQRISEGASTPNNTTQSESVPVQTLSQPQPTVPPLEIKKEPTKPLFNPETKPDVNIQSRYNQINPTSTSQVQINRNLPFLNIQKPSVLQIRRDVKASDLIKQKGETASLKLQIGDYNNILEGFKTGAKAFTLGGIYQAGATGKGLIEFAQKPFTKTGEAIKTTISVASNPINTIFSAADSFSKAPAFNLGRVTTGIALEKGSAVATKAVATKTNQAFVKTGSKKINNVFGGDVTAPSVSESLKQFDKAKKEIVTISPSKLQGNVIGEGRKGGLPTPLEDPGGYFAPMGSGNPMFLRLSSSFDSSITLNPIEAARSFKNLFDTPSATVFKVKAVSKQPRSVVSKPGFDASKEFLGKQAGSKIAFITKRSELGKGEIKPQSFTVVEDFKSPIQKTVIRDGKRIKTDEFKKGDKLFEAGTGETEAVLPAGTVFTYEPQTFIGKIKGFDEFTIVDGRAVAVRRAKVTGADGNVFVKNALVVDKKELPDSRFLKNSASLNRVDDKFKSLPSTTVSSQLFSNTNVSSYESEISNISTFGSNVQSFGNSSNISFNSPRSGFISGGSSGGSSGSTSRSSPASRPGGSSGSSPGGISGSSPGSSQKINFGFSKSTLRSSKNTKQTKVQDNYFKPWWDDDEKKEEEGFDVFIKKRGEFVKANNEALTKTSAINFGAFKVGTSASATFKLVESNKPGNKFFSPLANIKDFTQKKNKELTFVEKRERRIKSAGELKEITFAPRRKNRDWWK